MQGLSHLRKGGLGLGVVVDVLAQLDNHLRVRLRHKLGPLLDLHSRRRCIQSNRDWTPRLGNLLLLFLLQLAW